MSMAVNGAPARPRRWTNEQVGRAVLGLVLFPPVMLYRTWALVMLWGWFVAPLFGLPALTKMHAFGLILVWAYLMPSRGGQLDLLAALWRATLLATLTLAVGWGIRWLNA